MSFDLETLSILWDRLSPALSVAGVHLLLAAITSREIMKEADKTHHKRFRYQARSELRQILIHRDERLNGLPSTRFTRWRT